ncbi:extracellular solute-binding protein [Aliiruegeria sabulilitoris]|uniref:extracellular solute-binding protein n=1 Tax=Aliiruegeria sabulilitoris TaxID=1510458 RepID=UPI00082CEB74|nr:extracellular solute-binding protein [Aliiruegeria sabulilitoris]NDR57831.1 extracellular solute-binding protein [Pseudoruegeria sp. M32A2M]
MKNTFARLAATTALALVATAAAAEEKVVVFHFFEYMPQELIDKFTAETGVEIVMDTYDSNEAMLATLKAGGMGTYDVSVPADYMVKIMASEGMLDEIKEGELANKGNIEQKWLDVAFDAGRKYSIPYQWGSTSFAVNRDVYQGDIATTDILFDSPAELAGKVNMLDTQGEVMAMAAIHMGIEQCSTDRDQLKALNDMLQAAKSNWVSFNSDTAKEVLVSGDAAAGMIWNGFNAKARAEGANTEYAYPKQGYIVWMDNMVLLQDAPNRANALKLMDFLLEPENVAILTNWTQYSAGVEGVTPLLDEELRTLPEANPPADAGPGVFIEACDAETQAIYDRIWTALKQ